MISFNSKKGGWSGANAFKYGFKPLGSSNIILMSHVITKYAWSPSILKGGVRKKNCFDYADWIALDIDDGDPTLSQACENLFCDHIHIIGTTKSHQKWKNDKPPCDRYRVVLKLSKRIEYPEDYKATMQKMAKLYGTDKAAVDSARFFYPCTKIISISDEGYTVDPVTTNKASSAVKNAARSGVAGKGYFVGWLKQFIEKGDIPKYIAGRNSAVYSASVKLLSAGYKVDEIIDLLWNAPFDKSEFTHHECVKTIRSAELWFNSRGEK